MDRGKIISALQRIKALADECLTDLGGSAKPKRITKMSPAPPPAAKPIDVDFGVNERNFVKEHGRGLSGPKKFCLLVAYLAKGKVGVEVRLEDVGNHWNRMKSLLGFPFNRFYSNTAKDNGWVDTTKKGVYVLTKSWQQVLIK